MLSESDIVIGQFNAGTYGNFEIEGMMLGKSVVGYLNPDYEKWYEVPPPIISVNENNMEEDLYLKVEELILNPELRRSSALKSREYVSRIHDYKKVCLKLSSIIDSLYAKNNKNVIKEKENVP